MTGQVAGPDDAPVVGRISRLTRYPVKSLGGQLLDRVQVRPATGLDGDRIMAVLDLRTGRILSAKTEPRLLLASAAIHQGTVVVDVPGTGSFEASDPEAGTAVSDYLGRPVALVRSAEGHRATFERRVDLDPDSPTETMTTQEGVFFDNKSPVHLLSRQSVDHCRPLVPGAVWAPERFRANILVEAATDSQAPEFEWVGATLVAGETHLWVRKKTTRCVMPAHAHSPVIPADRRIFTALATERSNVLGVRVNPTRGATLEVGQDLLLFQRHGPHPPPDPTADEHSKASIEAWLGRSAR